MRIISQDGQTNIPYESVAIEIDCAYGKKYEIIASDHFADPNAEWMVLGEYPTYEKAVSVFENIISHGNLDKKIYRIPKSKEVN